uniref:Nuclear factor of kappa light polypeptide gene enhancer in B-cells inhibitor, epsilon n=1 Tax=Astyanax mexicanus TaxID=7994 RepID=A0A3B1JF08_ASTMX
MEPSGRAKGKFESEENRTDSVIDSGIDSFRSLPRDEPRLSGAAGSSAPGEQDKLSGGDERLDSAYGSSSIVDNLSEIIPDKCSISGTLSSQNTEENTEDEEEEEENLLTTVTEDGDTIVHLVIIHEYKAAAYDLISILPKEVLDIQNNLYQTPMHLAVYLNQPDVVKLLKENGACLELQDQDGNTPLHVACEHGRLECANEMILDSSPTKLVQVFETQNWRGLTCLHVATLHKQHRLMKLLMKKGVDLNIQEGTSGKTALHIAVELHDNEAVALLLIKGANVDAAMLNGCTALHLAVGRQDATITTRLCQAGADKMIRNMEDETALDLADGNDDILALFPFDDIQIMGRTVGVNF